MRAATDARARFAALALLLAASLAGGSAAAQEPATDPRWQGWLGCWEATDAQPGAPAGEPGAPLLCVLPAAGSSGVELTTLVAGEVVDRQTIEATGGPRPTSRDGCSGWESAEWSADGRRLYRRSEESCPGGATRRENGLSSLLPTGEWVDVQGAATGERMGVRVLRYREVADRDRWPAAALAELEGRGREVGTARTAAAVRLTTDDVVEASGLLDPAVVEAWLVERRQGFATELDADRLVALAEAGLPGSVIDLVVALSYPERFAIDQLTRDSERRPEEDGMGRRPVPGGFYPRGPFGYGGYGYYPWYGRYPDRTVIVGRPSGGDVGSGGRAVKGRGYRRGGGDGGSGSAGGSTSRSPSPGSVGSGGSEDSRSGSTRTAKPRSGGSGGTG